MPAGMKLLHRVEDALLVGLLGAMIVLAGLQILLRNFFDAGLIWIDPLLRLLVLWLGLIGAAIATRQQRHIQIDLLAGRIGPRADCVLRALVAQVGGWTCLVLAWHGLRWVRHDFADGLTAFAGVPAWLAEAIVPLAFAVMGLRFLAQSIVAARELRRPGARSPGA